MFLPLGDNVEHDRPPIAGFGIIAACTLVWLYSFKIDFGDSAHRTLIEFLHTWGLSGKELSQGHVIGLFTHMWLHVDVFHLLGNMFVLCAFMWTLEGVLGTGQFLFLYGISGLLAGAAHAALAWGSDIPMVGASGAIAGLIGAYFFKFGPMTHIRCLMFFFGRPIRFEVPSVVFVVVWLISQLWGVLTAEEGAGGVAWLAHGVGFGVGSLLMPLLYDEQECRVDRDKTGQLVIVDEKRVKPQQVKKTEQFALDTDTVIERCATCGTAIDESCRVAPGLWRCPNPSCVRLNYGMAATPAPVAAGPKGT